MNKKLAEIKFRGHFYLNEKDISNLWEMFMEYGLSRGGAKHRSSANHYFLQSICQNFSVEWMTWHRKMTKELKKIIKEDYPQLMVQNKEFEYQ